MPEPLHPPYGVTQPRTLVRWLDVNSQNGPLTRSRYFLDIPAFNIAKQTGFAYATIVGIYPYISTQPFTITDFSSIGNVPFTFCISFTDANGNLIRYKLNNGFAATLFFNPAQYTNQLIGNIGSGFRNRFQIEIWVNDYPFVISQEYQLSTSILAKSDYRYSLDAGIYPVGAMITNLSTPDLSLPFVFGSIAPPVPGGALADNLGGLITDNQGNIILVQ